MVGKKVQNKLIKKKGKNTLIMNERKVGKSYKKRDNNGFLNYKEYKIMGMQSRK